MRRSIFFTLAAVAVGTMASAANATPPAPYDWSGAYLGAFAGAASGASTATTVVGCPPGGYICDDDSYPENGALVGATGSGSASGSAFTGGGFAGRNWQNGSVVYGLEADIGTMPLSITNGGTATSMNDGLINDTDRVIFSMHATASTDWLATARARFGLLPLSNLLLYGTAGLAATELTVSNAYADNFTDPGGTGALENSSRSEFRTALVVGGGAEWAMTDRWTMRAEYLHADFGTLTTTGGVYYPNVTPEVNPATSTADLRVDIVRIGMAYGF